MDNERDRLRDQIRRFKALLGIARVYRADQPELIGLLAENLAYRRKLLAEVEERMRLN